MSELFQLIFYSNTLQHTRMIFIHSNSVDPRTCKCRVLNKNKKYFILRFFATISEQNQSCIPTLIEALFPDMQWLVTMSKTNICFKSTKVPDTYIKIHRQQLICFKFECNHVVIRYKISRLLWKSKLFVIFCNRWSDDKNTSRKCVKEFQDF